MSFSAAIATVGPLLQIPPHPEHWKCIAKPCKEFFGSYPGFEPFASSDSLDITVQTVRGRLTQSLS